MITIKRSLPMALMGLCFTVLFACNSDNDNNDAPNNDGDIIQDSPVTVSATVSTLAGTFLGQDGVGDEARFYFPYGVVAHGDYLYITETGNDTIRRMHVQTAEVTTLAGMAGSAGIQDGVAEAARFQYPTFLATDGTSLFVADGENHSVRSIDLATAAVGTLAGLPGSSDTIDGTGEAARFRYPRGLCIAGENLYVTGNLNHVVRKVVIATGEVTTFAGSANAAGFVNDVGADARFSRPAGLACTADAIYVADTFNQAIRKIDIDSGAVTTVAGDGTRGSNDGVGVAAVNSEERSARFYYPEGIVLYDGSLYITDTANNTIRVLDIAENTVTTIAGTAETEGIDDGVGGNALFNRPRGIAALNGFLYIADNDNHSIRRIEISSVTVSTVAGIAFNPGVNGVGPQAVLNEPRGMTVVGDSLYVMDSNNHSVREVALNSATVTTLAGNGERDYIDAPAIDAAFADAYDITTDGIDLYVADTFNDAIRKITLESGVVTTFAGGSQGTVDGMGEAAEFFSPKGVTSDGDYIYVADSSNDIIRKIHIESTEVTTLAGLARENGFVDATGADALFADPRGIEYVDGSLYICDNANHAIRKLEISSGRVSTLAGTGTEGYVDGSGDEAQFNRPNDITSDGTHLYVADTNNQVIRRITISTGEVTTLAGRFGVTGGTDGEGDQASFSYPYGITSNGDSLYVSDRYGNIIRQITIE